MSSWLWRVNCPVSLKLPQFVRVIPARGAASSCIPEGLQSVERRRRTRVAINPDSWPGSSSPFPLLSNSLENFIEGCGPGVKWLTSIPFIQMLCCRVITSKSFHVFGSCKFGVGRDGYSDIGDLGDISLLLFYA